MTHDSKTPGEQPSESGPSDPHVQPTAQPHVQPKPFVYPDSPADNADASAEIVALKAELDQLTKKVIEAGLATWSGAQDDRKSLLVRGQGNLLKDLSAIEDLERIRQLFDDLESKREIIQLLGSAEKGEGVRIFIGSENKLFSLSGSSLIVAPFHDETRKIVGVLGIIGPTRLNYGRLIPMIDYTAKLIGKALA